MYVGKEKECWTRQRGSGDLGIKLILPVTGCVFLKMKIQKNINLSASIQIKIWYNSVNICKDII